jgi:hypothetical protein
MARQYPLRQILRCFAPLWNLFSFPLKGERDKGWGVIGKFWLSFSCLTMLVLKLSYNLFGRGIAQEGMKPENRDVQGEDDG